MSKCQFT
ncbi:hypothetical protein D046_4925A, partial [Vibrio parahaemolyticus V-223/04]